MDLIDEKFAIEDIEAVAMFDDTGVRVVNDQAFCEVGFDLNDKQILLSYHARVQIIRDVFSAIKQAGYEVVKK